MAEPLQRLRHRPDPPFEADVIAMLLGYTERNQSQIDWNNCTKIYSLGRYT
jgi:hypothetical protein